MSLRNPTFNILLILGEGSGAEDGTHTGLDGYFI
jgi:hypothetical protein